MMNKPFKDGDVIISEEYYNQLARDSRFLDCLRANGVDNWEFFDDAVDMYEEKESN